MAFTLGELFNNIELDLPDASTQPTVSPQKKGFNLVTSITAYWRGEHIGQKRRTGFRSVLGGRGQLQRLVDYRAHGYQQ